MSACVCADGVASHKCLDGPLVLLVVIWLRVARLKEFDVGEALHIVPLTERLRIVGRAVHLTDQQLG